MNSTTLRKLPRLDEVWFADRRPVNLQIVDMGPIDLLLWMTQDGRVRMGAPIPRSAGAEVWLEEFRRAAEQPVAGFSRGLPREVRAVDPAAVSVLAKALKPLGVAVAGSPRIPEMDEVLQGFERHLNPSPVASYMECLEGPLPQKRRVITAFYQEAQRLHGDAPWCCTNDSELLRVRGLTPTPLLISVMGAAGIEEGIAVFLSETAAAQFFTQDAKLTGERCASLTYCPAESAPALVREAQGLKVPLPEDLVPLALTITDQNRGSTLEEMEIVTRASEVVRLYFGSQRLPAGVEVEWPLVMDGGRAVTPKPKDLYQLRIELRHTDVWRTIIVPSDWMLDELHTVIQEAMGWEDCHLYCFETKKQRFDPEDDVEIAEVLPRVRGKLQYLYDFGDGWIHDIVLEKRLPPDGHLPAVDLIAGEGACPPEDCGGVGGYHRLVEAMTTPRHPDKAEWRERVGRFDPKKFNLAKTRRQVQALLEEE